MYEYTCHFSYGRFSALYKISIAGYIKSLSVPTVVNFTNQTLPAHTPAMSVFHCGMLEVKLVNNICIVWSLFPVRVRKELVVFLYCFHTSILIGYLIGSSYGDTTALYSLLLPLWQLSAEIITSVSRVMKFAPSSEEGLSTHSHDPMASLIPEKSLGCWIPSMILVRTGLGYQMSALKFVQYADHIIQCLRALCLWQTCCASITALSRSCTWSWLRTDDTFAVLLINMQMAISQTYIRVIPYLMPLSQPAVRATALGCLVLRWSNVSNSASPVADWGLKVILQPPYRQHTSLAIAVPPTHRIARRKSHSEGTFNVLTPCLRGTFKVRSPCHRPCVHMAVCVSVPQWRVAGALKAGQNVLYSFVGCPVELLARDWAS